MPNFQTHFSAAILVPALAVGFGTAYYAWDNTAAGLGFIAGFSGAMLPDLDSDTSRPLRAAASIVGFAFAGFAYSFFSVKSSFLNRPWSVQYVYMAAFAAYVLFNIIFVEIMKRTTRHRGLFHSIPMALLYAGCWTFFLTPFGAKTTIAVWFMAVLGVFVHLVLDAVCSFSLNPLKLFTYNIKNSYCLWFLVALITFLVFYRL